MDRLAQTSGLMNPQNRKRRPTTKTWESYERLAHFLLNTYADDFCLQHVERKQHVTGNRSKAKWEIDAKGVNRGGQAFMLVEVRRYMTRRISQEAMGGFAYRIRDTGAAGGIIVTPLGLQKGAKLVAADANVQSVLLIPGQENGSFLARFLSRIVLGMPVDTLQVSHTFLGGTLTTGVRSE